LSFDFLKRLNTTDQSHSLFQTRLISLKISCSTIVAKKARRKKKDEQHGPHQETGVNPEVREVYAALVFYTSRCEQHNHKTWNYLMK
jgi:hypothetical protein